MGKISPINPPLSSLQTSHGQAELFRSNLIINAPCHRFPVPGVPLARQDAHVRPPEGRVTQCIADRVDGGVDVAQRVEKVPQLLGDATGAGSQGLEQHQDVVRRPGDDEAE